MKAHLLVEQLRAGTIRRFYEPNVQGLHERQLEHDRKRAEQIAGAHKFACKFAGVIDDQALHQTAVDLWRADILRLPFALCYFEIEGPSPHWVNAVLAQDSGWRDHLGGGMDVIFCPYVFRDGVWFDVGAKAHSAISAARPDYPKEFISTGNLTFTEENKKTAREHCDLGSKNVIDLICLMSTKYAATETIAAPERLNKRRKERGRSPLFEHKIITIDPTKAEPSEVSLGTHASPRLHWRRGHVRRLPSGTRTAVRPCLVGRAEDGFISKDYMLKAPIGASEGASS